MGTESVVLKKAPLPTPKAIIQQTFGTKVVYKTEEVKESAKNVCPGLAIPQGPCLFRCCLELPGITVISEACKRKKDAEQSAAKTAIEKLGIKTGPNELTVEELCDELVTRVSYVFSDEFLPSPHPLTGHLRAALTRRGHLRGLVPASILAACDQKVNNLCKSINRKVETDHLLSIPLIMKAATLSGSVATDEGKLWIRKQNQYSPETIEAVTNGNPSAENICVQAIRIPCSLEKPVQPLSLNISSKEYYVDVIAEKLGVADASHVLLSRTIGKSSSEMRVYFSPLGLPLKSDSTLEDLSYEAETLNLRASYLSGQNIHGEAILATFGYTWKCIDLFHEDVTLGTYYRMLVGRLPDGGYKLSRDAVIVADLPTAFTTRTNWRGSYPRDLLSTFCHLHWLPEPEFSTICVNDATQSPTKKQKIEETANEGAVEANSKEVIMGSGATFKCDVKIVSASHDVIMECSPGDCYKGQGDAVQSTSLKVLLWLNKYFKQLGVPIEKWSPSENSALGVRVYPKNFLKEFALCASIHTVQHASVLSKDSVGRPNRVEELVEMNRHYNIVSPPKIEGLDSGVSPSNGSLVCISYDISLVREGEEDMKETLESSEEFEFDVGSGFVVPQIETCVTQMSAGQSAFFMTELPHQLLVLSSAGGCAKSLTSSSLKDCALKYSIHLLWVQEPLEDCMEHTLFSPPLSKQRVEYAANINESCAATLLRFSYRSYFGSCYLERGTLLMGTRGCDGRVLSCESRSTFEDEVVTVPMDGEMGVAGWEEEKYSRKWSIHEHYVALTAGSALGTVILDDLEKEVNRRISANGVVNHAVLESILCTEYLRKKSEYREVDGVDKIMKDLAFLVAALDNNKELKMKFYGFSVEKNAFSGKECDPHYSAGSGYYEADKTVEGTGYFKAIKMIKGKLIPTFTAAKIVLAHKDAMLASNKVNITVGGVQKIIMVQAVNGKLFVRHFNHDIGTRYRVRKFGNGYKEEVVISELQPPVRHEIIAALAEKGVTKLSPVQRTVLLPARLGYDIICKARTGTVKTLALWIPIMEKFLKFKDEHGKGVKGYPLAVVLAPTKESARQVVEEFRASDVNALCAHGVGFPSTFGDKIDVDIVVAVPSSILDMCGRGNLNLSAVQVVVVVDADDMLNRRLLNDVEDVLRRLQKERQNMMFSATIPPAIKALIVKYFVNPVTVDLVALYSIEAEFLSKPSNVHYLIRVHAKGGKTIIFTATEREAIDYEVRMESESTPKEAKLTRCKALKFNQFLKKRTVADFNDGKFSILVATDADADVLGLTNVDLVIHYGVPTSKIFVTRCGRTGVGGKEGTAIVVHSRKEIGKLQEIETDVGCKFIELPKIAPETLGSTHLESGGGGASGGGGGGSGGGGGPSGGYGGGSDSGPSGGSGGRKSYASALKMQKWFM
ncbi:hypothetical protein MKX03_026852 [Papaver bracteatum]|nr:hypothetical protein MKX03_026852 [Papaver bracteatum]